MNPSASRSSLIARNSLLNLAGQAVPLVVGVVCIPFVIKGLGEEGFGILSLSWMLLGYFALFDLGLGRATTKLISEELRNGVTDKLRSLFWTSCATNLVLGLVGGIIVVLLAPFLAHTVFQISPGLEELAKRTFTLLGLSLPIVLVSTVLRGTLEAAQRFDYLNSVVVAANSLNYFLPVLGILLGLDVSQIVLLLMGSRSVASAVYFVLCTKVLPNLWHWAHPSTEMTKRLLRFGGWLTVSNAVQPALMYLDRLMIGSMLSLAAVTYYTAPYEIATRLLILPVSLAVTLFPSFSSAEVADRHELAPLYIRSAKLLLLLMGPVVALVILFAKEILGLWLGVEFADKSTTAFQVLAFGVLVNSPANVPYALVQGFGRPDLTAKFHLFELLIYIPLVWFLVKTLGIAGGAMAWTLRITLDAVLLFAASSKLMHRQFSFEQGLGRTITQVGALMCVVCILLLLQMSIAVKSAMALLVVILFSLSSWRYVMDGAEKRFLIWTGRRFARGIVGGNDAVG
jgi:O-antigen/teichoic acid export membrane protein